MKSTTKKPTVKATAKKAPVKTTAKKAPVKTTAKKAPVKATAKKAPVKTTAKKAAQKSTENKIPMKSKKNLTRFTYDTAAFEGWRLCLSKKGTTFTRYFSDKKYGTGKKSLVAAEQALADLKLLIDGSNLVDGKLPPSTIKKAEKMLKDAD